MWDEACATQPGPVLGTKTLSCGDALSPCLISSQDPAEILVLARSLGPVVGGAGCSGVPLQGQLPIPRIAHWVTPLPGAASGQHATDVGLQRPSSLPSTGTTRKDHHSSRRPHGGLCNNLIAGHLLPLPVPAFLLTGRCIFRGHAPVNLRVILQLSISFQEPSLRYSSQTEANLSIR